MTKNSKEAYGHYVKNLGGLSEQYGGRVVLIHWSQIRGVYANEHEALESIEDKDNIDDYLIQRVPLKEEDDSPLPTEQKTFVIKCGQSSGGGNYPIKGTHVNYVRHGYSGGWLRVFDGNNVVAEFDGGAVAGWWEKSKQK